MDHIPPLDTQKDSSIQIKPATSSSVKQLELIYGYIRGVQAILAKTIIIPDEIYSLCLQFYQENASTILWTSFKWFNNDYFLRSSGSRECGILDMKNKVSVKINLNKCKNTQNMNPLCYIPNISNKTLTNNERLQGIFAVTEYASSTKFPCLILFDQDSSETELQISAKYEHESQKSMYGPHQFLYSESRIEIMHEFDGKFYSLNLNDINQVNDLSNFTELHQEKQKYKFDNVKRETFGYEYLEMLYLEQNESIFCVPASYSLFVMDSMGRPMIASPAEKSCGIFNITTHDWIDTKPLKHLEGHNHYLACKLCSNYMNDTIYLFDEADINYTYKYDMIKDEWNTVSMDDSLVNLLMFWNDGDVLFGLTHSTINESKDYKFQLNKLDIRDNKREWIKTGVDFVGMDKERWYEFFR